MAAHKDHFGCPGEPFWLARRSIEAAPALLNVRFLFSFLPMPPLKREYKAISAIAGEIWHYRTGENLTILNKDHDTAEEGRSPEAKFLQPSIRLRYNYYVQLVATKRGRMRVANLKIWSPRQRGGVKLVVHITVVYNLIKY